MKKYFANSKNKQDLKQHLLGVARRSVEVLRDTGVNEEVFGRLVVPTFISGLLHDIGKVHNKFQKYIVSKQSKKNEHSELTDAEEGRKEIVFHNEISWLFLSKYMVKAGNNINIATLNNIVQYSVYWHHPKEDVNGARDNCNLLVEALGGDIEILEILEEMKLFFDQQLQQHTDLKLNTSPSTYENENAPLYIDYRKVDQYSDNFLVSMCLIEADREVSSWDNNRLNNYINNNQEDILRNSIKWPNNYTVDSDNKRSFAQSTLAKNMSLQPISICGADTGAGKTRISILWKNYINSDRKMIFLLPKRRQIDATYNVLVNDLDQMYGKNNIKVQASHSGEVMYHTNNYTPNRDYHTGGDINILTFDRPLSSAYNRSRFSEFLDVIKSDLVIDEYHEFADQPRMRPVLKIILNIRRMLSNGGKTLLLSGTPDPALNEHIFNNNMDGVSVFNRNELVEAESTKMVYSFFNETMKKLDNLENTLVSFNYVEETLKQVTQFPQENKVVAHSKFYTDHLTKHMKDIIEGCGKTNKDNKLTVFSAPILQSSFDISRKHLRLTASDPNTLTQFLGRGNRWGEHLDGTVNIYKEENLAAFNDNKRGGKQTYLNFEEHLKNILKEPLLLTKREAITLIWEDFWKNEENIKNRLKELDKGIEDAAKKIQNIYPRRNTGKKNNKATGTGGIFRDTSKAISLLIIDSCDNKMLQGEELYYSSSEYEVLPMIDAMKYVIHTSKKNLKLLNGDMFSLVETDFKNKPEIWMGRKGIDKPIIASHCEEKINKLLTKILKEKYTVYSMKYGVIKLTTFNNESVKQSFDKKDR